MIQLFFSITSSNSISTFLFGTYFNESSRRQVCIRKISINSVKNISIMTNSVNSRSYSCLHIRQAINSALKWHSLTFPSTSKRLYKYRCTIFCLITSTLGKCNPAYKLMLSIVYYVFIYFTCIF